MSRPPWKLTDEILELFVEQARIRTQLLPYKELAARAQCTEKYVQQVMSRLQRNMFKANPRSIESLARELSPALQRLADQ